MKPYSIKRFSELLEQDRIRRNWNGIYFDIADYPFYDENRATPEVLNALYEICYPKSYIQELINEQMRKQDQKDATRYFKHKYPYIKYIEKYIDLLQKYDIPNRTIDHCLELIAYDMKPIFLEVKLGKDIATQIEELKKETPYQYGKHAKEVR